MNRKHPLDAQQVYERQLREELRLLEEEKWKRNEALKGEAAEDPVCHGVAHSDFDGREFPGQPGGLRGALAWGAMNWASLGKEVASTFLYPGQAAGKDAKYYADIGKEYEAMLRRNLMRFDSEYLKNPGLMQQEARGSDPITAWDKGLHTARRLVIGEGESDPEKTSKAAAGLAVRATMEQILPEVEKSMVAAGVRGATGLTQTAPFVGFIATYLTSDKVDLPEQIFTLDKALKTMAMLKSVAEKKSAPLGKNFNEEHKKIQLDMRKLQRQFGSGIYTISVDAYHQRIFEFTERLNAEERRLLGEPQ